MKIEEMSGNEYSQGRYSRAYDERGNSYGYDNDTSEARHYVRGHYSRRGGRYSMAEGIWRDISIYRDIRSASCYWSSKNWYAVR
mgnify:CR=1 FL=1